MLSNQRVKIILSWRINGTSFLLPLVITPEIISRGGQSDFGICTNHDYQSSRWHSCQSHRPGRKFRGLSAIRFCNRCDLWKLVSTQVILLNLKNCDLSCEDNRERSRHSDSSRQATCPNSDKFELQQRLADLSATFLGKFGRGFALRWSVWPWLRPWHHPGPSQRLSRECRAEHRLTIYSSPGQPRFPPISTHPNELMPFAVTSISIGMSSKCKLRI